MAKSYFLEHFISIISMTYFLLGHSVLDRMSSGGLR